MGNISSTEEKNNPNNSIDGTTPQQTAADEVKHSISSLLSMQQRMEKTRRRKAKVKAFTKLRMIRGTFYIMKYQIFLA